MFVGSEKIFVLCLYSIWYVSYGHLFMMLVYLCNFIVGMVFYPHRDVQGKHYTLIDVPVHGEQTKPNFGFVFVSAVSYDHLNRHL